MSDRPADPFGLFESAPAAPEIGAAPAVDLAASLAARLCHDLISPASAIVSGVDLLEDPTQDDMRDDALNLIGASARKLVALLAFARVAFGASAAAESFDSAELQRLAGGVFAHVRADLDWRVEAPTLNKASARALLNLAQIGATALPMGGTATVTASLQGSDMLMAVECVSPRARMRPELESGLRGEPLGEGQLHGHWVQAFYLHALLAAAGGSVDGVAEEGRVMLRARAPA